MQSLTPAAQDGTGGLQGVQEVATDPPPSFTGPAEAKWVGFGAFIVIFLIVMILIIRGRVLRPAQRNSVRSAVFEPAGEGAEITFDDPELRAQPAAPAIETETDHGDDADQDQRAAADDGDTDQLTEDEAPQDDKPRKSPFAGLFSKKKSEETPAPDETEELGALNEAEEPEPPAIEPEEIFEGPADRRAAEFEASQEQLRREEAEREAARLIEARELEERRAEEELRAQAEREADHERRKNQAAIEQGLQSLGARDDLHPSDVGATRAAIEAEDRIQNIGAALESRMATLFDQLDARVSAAPASAAAEEHAVISEAHFSEFAELLSEQITALRESANSAIENLSKRLAQLETAPAGAAALTSQVADLNRILGGALNVAPENNTGLKDVLAQSLAPDQYSAPYRLSNGKLAEGLVSMPGGALPVVVSEQFPVDAFGAYQRQRLAAGGGATAENNFRNIIRRHIADTAQNFIIPGETAAHAFMLIPSEQLFASLNADFADLVQESRNAGLWMMSPTTLAATLKTVHSVADTTPKDGAGGELLEEIIALRERVTMLEHEEPADPEKRDDVAEAPVGLWENGAPRAAESRQDAPATESDAPSMAPEQAEPPTATSNPFRSLSPEEEAFERLEREESLAETDADDNAKKSARPPFPLR